MGRFLPMAAAALLLGACGSPELPPAASADSIDKAVNNAERELAAVKGGKDEKKPAGLFGV